MENIRVRDFVVESTLGSGGMATVYLAHQEPGGLKVALKLMHPHLAKNELFVKRFLREIAASAELRHENIVQVIASGEDGGNYFIASEFVDGGSLEQLLVENGRLPFIVAAELGRQLLSGLAYAHAASLIHRDVKPANLLLMNDGALKIADFGIAKSEAATTLTQTGGVLGTPAYMSPEQAAGKPVDLRSDLFSAGVVCYEMLSGTNPFLADTPTATMVKILRSDPSSLFEVAPEVPQALAQVVESLLERDPSRRPQSAQEAAAQLETWIAGEAVRGRQTVFAYLKDPKGIAARTRLYFAQRAVKRAKELLAGDPATRLRAAFEALRALQLAPEEPAVQALVAEIQALHVQFGAAKNPKITELEATLADNDSVGVHTQLASLYRLEGNLWKAAVHLKRAVRLRPNDGYLTGQLATLTGEAPGALAPIPLTQQQPPLPTYGSVPRSAFNAPAAAVAVEEELHTGQTGQVRVRPAAAAAFAPIERAPSQPPPPAPSLLVQLPGALWNGGGKYLFVLALIVGGLVWGIRIASRGIDQATLEEKKVHDLSIKITEARARAIVNPAAAAQDEANLRRLGDPDFDRGREAASAGRHEEAAEAFATFIAKSPNRPAAAVAQFLRARSLIAAKQWDPAVAELEEFLAVNPAHTDAAEARVLLAEAFLGAHRFEPAVDAASRAIVEGDMSELAIRARVVRARASLELGARDAALRDAQFVKDHVSAASPGYRAALEVLSAAGVPVEPDRRPNE